MLPPLLTHLHVQFCYCAQSLPEKLSEIQLTQKSLAGLRLSEYQAKVSYVDVVAKEVKFEENLPIMVQLPYRQPAVVRDIGNVAVLVYSWSYLSSCMHVCNYCIKTQCLCIPITIMDTHRHTFIVQLSKAEKKRRAETRRKQGLRLQEIQREKRLRAMEHKQEELDQLIALKTTLDNKRDKLRAKWAKASGTSKSSSKKRKATPGGAAEDETVVDPQVQEWRLNKEREQEAKTLAKTEFETREQLERTLAATQTEMEKLSAPPAKRKKSIVKVWRKRGCTAVVSGLDSFGVYVG